MEYTKEYVAKEEHIDVQNIMDGLYYPFYMEYCRHDYIREVLGFDFEEQARNGVHMVLSGYRIQFLRSLKKGDQFTVTCTLYADPAGQPRLHFKQSIILNGKVMTKAVFTGTCVPASGGRPYLPAAMAEKTAGAPVLDKSEA
ncbi:thioesterase family protein [Chitinophaga arvensicola]|uniref:Acyl-CoA thioester hydrolase n=1 Tax=Chitinophaga arvensicola TaxID=29529 RepID=A0A1I0S7A5_9BACT|nr:thioesterase family protein [Chitinophaga arvensicola]SEW51446.1 acyl-CoA thioester hydrolase [Chitinophaga arvensicola]